MYMCVCMCVFVWVCVCTYLYACVCVCVCVYIYICTHTHTQTHTYTYVHTHTHTHTNTHTYICTHTHTIHIKNNFCIVHLKFTSLRDTSYVPVTYLMTLSLAHTDCSGCAVQGVGLRPLACWDCGFESCRGMDVTAEWCVLSGRGSLHICMVCVCVYIYIYIYTHTHTHTHTPYKLTMLASRLCIFHITSQEQQQKELQTSWSW